MLNISANWQASWCTIILLINSLHVQFQDCQVFVSRMQMIVTDGEVMANVNCKPITGIGLLMNVFCPYIYEKCGWIVRVWGHIKTDGLSGSSFVTHDRSWRAEWIIFCDPWPVMTHGAFSWLWLRCGGICWNHLKKKMGVSMGYRSTPEICRYTQVKLNYNGRFSSLALGGWEVTLRWWLGRPAVCGHWACSKTQPDYSPLTIH